MQTSGATTSSLSSSLGAAAYLETGRTSTARPSSHKTRHVCPPCDSSSVERARLLIAFTFGGLPRTMKALTLQRHQLTVPVSCILITLPSTKASKRTGRRRPHVNHQPFAGSHCTRQLYVASVLQPFSCHLPCSHQSFGIGCLSCHAIQSTAWRRHDSSDAVP